MTARLTPEQDAARIAYGQRLRAWRTAEGLTLAVVARLCGVAIATVTKWERGEATPTEQHRHALVRAGFGGAAREGESMKALAFRASFLARAGRIVEAHAWVEALVYAAVLEGAEARA